MTSVAALLIRRRASSIFFGAVAGSLLLLWWAPINLKIIAVAAIAAVVVFTIHYFVARLGGEHAFYLSMAALIVPGLVFTRDVESGVLIYGLNFFVVLSGLHWLARSIGKTEKKIEHEMQR